MPRVTKQAGEREGHCCWLTGSTVSSISGGERLESCPLRFTDCYWKYNVLRGVRHLLNLKSADCIRDLVAAARVEDSPELMRSDLVDSSEMCSEDLS